MFKDKRTAMVGTLVVAVFLSLLTFMTPAKALAAYECFICLPDIQVDTIFGSGPCPGAIPIISWSFGETAGTTATATVGGRAAGRVTMQDFKFTMRTNKASTTLFQNCATGRSMRQAKLIVRGAFANQQAEFLRITLTDVFVSSFVNLGNSGSTQAYPIEEVSFSFGKIEIEYIEMGPDGKSRGTVKGGYDVRGQTPTK